MKYCVILIFVATSAISGCQILGAFSGSAVDLSADRTSYEPGAVARLTIRNDAPREIGFNLCMSLLEREIGGAWAVTAEGEGWTRIHTDSFEVRAEV